MVDVQTHSGKPLVMLIPDSICWVLGTWAQQIARWNSWAYEFLFFPLSEVHENQSLFASLLQEVDVVHCLTSWGFQSVRAIIDREQPADLLVISSIHHIVEFSQIADCLQAARIMVVCKKYWDELLSRGVSAEKIFLVYNGVDIQRFASGDKKRSKKELGISPEGFTIGFSAKASSDHDGRKGIDAFRSAVSAAGSGRKIPVELVLTGPGWSELVRDFSQLGVQVHYFPFLAPAQMPVFYNSLDAYLVTARVEGGPVPLLEAMSCGVPVITTPVGTALDFIHDGVNGVMVQFGEVDKIAAAIEHFYHDREFARRIGVAGRKTIIEHLQWKDTVAHMSELYTAPCAAVKKKPSRLSSRAIAELNARLIKRDEERWRRQLDQYPAFGYDPAAPLLKRLVSWIRSRLKRAQ